MNCPKKFKNEFCVNGGKCKLCDGTFDIRYARIKPDGQPMTNEEYQQAKRMKHSNKK